MWLRFLRNARTKKSHRISRERLVDIACYIDAQYEETPAERGAESVQMLRAGDLVNAKPSLPDSAEQEIFARKSIGSPQRNRARADVFESNRANLAGLEEALEQMDESFSEMLKKAGFAFSHSSKSDIIVEYFVEHGNYNVYDINEALFAFDQCLIGG